MKHRILFASALAFSSALATPALADNWYAGVSGDYTWFDSVSGGGANADLGYRFLQSNFGDARLEGEFGYHAIPNSSSHVGNTHYYTYMGNAYYDFTSIFPSSSWHVVPYLGAGIGDATVRFGSRSGSGFVSFGENDNVFAYQFMGGLSFIAPSMPNTEWTIGYRYLGSDTTGTSVAGVSNRLNANNAEVGVRFHF